MQRRLLRRIAYLRRNRCSGLLAALFVVILVEPALVGSRWGAISLSLGVVAILLVAVWALRVQRMMFWIAGLLALLMVHAVVVDRLGEHWLRPVTFAAIAVFMGVVTVSLLRYVLDWHPISTDKVFGAVSAYVLIAFTFASLYGLLQMVETHSFHVAFAMGPDDYLGWADMVYFSFTVLTSTGFGEITPASGLARSLIVVEQVIGVMYVAFLIARLANLYGAHQHRR